MVTLRQEHGHSVQLVMDIVHMYGDIISQLIINGYDYVSSIEYDTHLCQ